MVPVMEQELLKTQGDMAGMTELGVTSFIFDIVGTEQGIQARITLMQGDDVLQDEVVHMSASYTDLLRLSFDMEKGKLQPPYSIPGTGLEVAHWIWKKLK